MQGQWWKEGVVYQIYPRSFQDSNKDGIGDLRGIISRLDYLVDLGIDIVWLNPVYASPNDDNGYDISDYEAIMGEFGTMADFDELLDGLHARGIKLIMDLVVNHTSDEHPWFVESRKGPDNAYRDWYVWRDGQPGGNSEQPPNNWQSFFSGPAWEKDEATGQYYLHLFTRRQPDLNWEHEPVREAVYAMMNRWFDRGIDGFRMDVINLISKVPGLPSVPGVRTGELAWGGDYFTNGPRLHEYLQELHRATLAGRDVMTVGECVGLTLEDGRQLVGSDRGELDMVFQMQHMDLDAGPYSKWDHQPDWSRAEYKRIIGEWVNGLHGIGWNSQYWTNHDQPRPVSRFGDDHPAHREDSALALATLLLTLPGTPYIYQGDEIGMTNFAGELDDYRDVETLNWYREQSARGRSHAELMALIHVKSRDNTRTPMQWSDGANAGFTGGTPWIPVNDNYRDINVDEARARPDSVWQGYRQLIAYRKQNPGLAYARIEWLWPEHEQLVCFHAVNDTVGSQPGEWLVLTNLSSRAVELPTTDYPLTASWDWTNRSAETLKNAVLAPWEARVRRLA